MWWVTSGWPDMQPLWNLLWIFHQIYPGSQCKARAFEKYSFSFILRRKKVSVLSLFLARQSESRGWFRRHSCSLVSSRWCFGDGWTITKCGPDSHSLIDSFPLGQVWNCLPQFHKGGWRFLELGYTGLQKEGGIKSADVDEERIYLPS